MHLLLMETPIYLDYHATTPVDPLVLEAMLPWFSMQYGNPASRSHSFGWQADEAVSIARRQIATLLQVDDRGIYFTSGATEGINQLLKGIAESHGQHKKHIISFATEHRAVLDTLHWLSTRGFEIQILPVTHEGNPDLDQFAEAIRTDTLFATAMWANNETGVINDMTTLAAICNEKEVTLISDATQAVGKIEVHPTTVGVDMIAFSAHKLYGPKGVGAVYIDPASKLKPAALIHGGGHENGLRSGTLNVPGIVGLGAAAKFAMNLAVYERPRIGSLRDDIESELINSLEGVTVNGNVNNRLHTVSNLQITWTDSQAIMSSFRNKLAIAAGSACSAADPSPSHVLLAMGLSPTQAKGSIRISLGRYTTADDVTNAAQLIIRAVNEYRTTSPAWNMYKQGLITEESGWA
jgi:cysteine desulfurase